MLYSSIKLFAVISLTSVLTISKGWLWYFKKLMVMERVENKITDSPMNTGSERASIEMAWLVVLWLVKN
jgi:hypothetical protein